MRIAHIAIRVDDLESASEFYQQSLGMRSVREGHVRDHYSRHLTDGNLDIALIRYDRDADSREAAASGEGPCIHHFGFCVDDVEAWRDKVTAMGCEILSESGVIPVKFRAPGGIVMEFAPRGHFDLEPR